MFDKGLLQLKGIKGALVFCAAISVCRALLVIGQAVALSAAIVDVWGGAPVYDQLFRVLLFTCCFIGRECLKAFQEARMESYAHRVVSAMRLQLLDALYRNGVSMVHGFGSAAIVSEAVDGVQKAETYISVVVPKTVAILVMPLCIVVAVFAQDVVSGIIVAVCYPFIIVFMRLIGYTASDESAKRHEGFVAMSAHFLDSLRGMGTLRAFGLSRLYVNSIYAASEHYRESVIKTLRIATLSSAVLDVFATCGLAAVAIMLGFRLVEGTLEFLPALVVLMLVPEFFLPIKAYASDYHASLDGKSALASILGMMGVQRRKVGLGGMSVSVAPGEKVAIVGRSGSGKTTLLDVIAGVIDFDDGAVEVCGVSGLALAGEDWQRRIAYIPQQPYLFSGTLRDNVALYASRATDAEILEAIERVGLGGLVDRMPDGLDTVVGHGGRALSGGEAHRLSLARALLVDRVRDVWLLDEPGASLDAQTESELKRSILELGEGKTIIVATHRMHWLADVDKHVDVGGIAAGRERTSRVACGVASCGDGDSVCGGSPEKPLGHEDDGGDDV